MLNDRLEAIGRGEFDPVDRRIRPGIRPGGRASAGPAAGFGRTRRPGRWAPGGPGGRGGGPRARLRPRRARRPPERLQRPVELLVRRLGARQRAVPAAARTRSAQQRPYQPADTSAVTVGGPVQDPGIYNGDARTNFTATYTGNRGGDLFDQYATVPDRGDARRGFLVSPVPADRSRAPGLPFTGNQIPAARMSAALARAAPVHSACRTSTAPAATSTTSTTNASHRDSINLRVTHNFTPNARRPRRAGGRGGGGRGGGAADRADAAAAATAGHQRQHDGAAAVPPQRQRSDQRLPDARRAATGLEPHACRSRSTSSTSGRCTPST